MQRKHQRCDLKDAERSLHSCVVLKDLTHSQSANTLMLFYVQIRFLMPSAPQRVDTFYEYSALVDSNVA